MNLSLLAQRDPIFKRIWQAVPRSVDAALREDIISDIYLEIREGNLHPRDIELQARRFISAGFAAWANPWGELSLSCNRRGDEAGEDFTERIEDEGALAAFDRVRFRRERET